MTDADVTFVTSSTSSTCVKFLSTWVKFYPVWHNMWEYECVNWDKCQILLIEMLYYICSYTIFWVWNVSNYALSSGKFLNYGESAGVKVLTNIMSGCHPVGGWNGWKWMGRPYLKGYHTGKVQHGHQGHWSSWYIIKRPWKGLEVGVNYNAPLFFLAPFKVWDLLEAWQAISPRWIIQLRTSGMTSVCHHHYNTVFKIRNLKMWRYEITPKSLQYVLWANDSSESECLHETLTKHRM